jgi:hypothetical protein
MRILFFNHKVKECGVYQYGYRVFHILKIHQILRIIIKN